MPEKLVALLRLDFMVIFILVLVIFMLNSITGSQLEPDTIVATTLVIIYLTACCLGK